MEFSLNTGQDYIELIKLLKVCGAADTGSEAKALVEDEMVVVNGEVELRKRYKVRKKDKIEVNGLIIDVV
ncbi:MAG: RNA-binding protein [Flavobacteriales bacterium]|nr:RNA-binding protein [Flavobacteriales bacterium]